MSTGTWITSDNLCLDMPYANTVPLYFRIGVDYTFMLLRRTFHFHLAYNDGVDDIFYKVFPDY